MSSDAVYVELHAHSAFSFGDGASLPGELIDQATELGYTALALTDHNTVSGSMELAMAARESTVRAIQGAEVNIAHPVEERVCHLTLLVRDRAGWRNLCRLLTLAHAGTRERPDRRATEPVLAFDALLEHAEGLVCLTGCAEHGIHDPTSCRLLLDAFGPDSLRVELQRPYARGDRTRLKMLERLAGQLDVPAVATGNVHAHNHQRAPLQDALVAARHGQSLDASEMELRPNHAHVLTRPEAMAARFAEHPEAVAETVRLADTLHFRLTGDLGYRYPGADDTAATRELAEVCMVEFNGRYPRHGALHDEAHARLQEELRIIEHLALPGFFLLHHQILELAREVAVQVRGPGTARALLPPGRGRGSSVSSIVCYLTGLSHIDPIENKLAIGRFLHEDVESLPDIDIDFPRDIREKLIVRIHERHGRDRTALVAAFPTYKSRGAIRDLGKALGLPAGEIERVARGSEGWGGQGTVARDIQVALGEQRLTGRWGWLAKLADEAHGLPTNLSQHPGGMVLSTRPLTDCCPIVPAQMEGRQMVMWDKDSCSDAGLLKIDLLGLGMLSAVERTVEMIAARRGEQIDLSRIPFDDQQVYSAIQAADTVGVFQIESRAQMGSLRRTRPASLADLTIQVALVRPGPIVGGSVSPYIERKQRQRVDPDFQVPYLHPSLQEPLAETLGTIIFQDQVIEVARAFAGFSAGEAESLRRAMSRKRSQEAIDSHRERFVQGARATHPDATEQVIEQVWSMIGGFAGFGFPKSHGAAFGLLAYQSTWLRVHYAPEFLAALLNEQPMGFYAPDSLIHEAQRRGIEVLPADVNHSDHECQVTPSGSIRLGLSYIKGIRDEDVCRLLAARGRGGYRSLEQLAATAGVSAATLERLAWSGACDELAGGGPHARRVALWQLGVTTPAYTCDAGGQLALELPLDQAPGLPAHTPWEQMLADYQATGVSIGQHPVELLRPMLDQQGATPINQLPKVAHGTSVTVGGLVIARQRPQTANGIIFLLLEDAGGSLNVIVPEKLYEPHRLTIRTEPLILVHGRLERHIAGGGAINLLATRLQPLHPASAIATVRHLHPQPKPTTTSTDAEDFKATAPAVMSFGQGRRR
jgi:error-prone DNA polymerase